MVSYRLIMCFVPNLSRNGLRVDYHSCNVHAVRHPFIATKARVNCQSTDTSATVTAVPVPLLTNILQDALHTLSIRCRCLPVAPVNCDRPLEVMGAFSA
jgi:hypothetical protein